MSKQTDSLGKQPLDVNALISRHAAHTDEESDPSEHLCRDLFLLSPT